MRFVLMHKQGKNSEAGVPPSAELMAGMGKFLSEGAQAGVFRSGEGLFASSKRAAQLPGRPVYRYERALRRIE